MYHYYLEGNFGNKLNKLLYNMLYFIITTNEAIQYWTIKIITTQYLHLPYVVKPYIECGDIFSVIVFGVLLIILTIL